VSADGHASAPPPGSPQLRRRLPPSSPILSSATEVVGGRVTPLCMWKVGIQDGLYIREKLLACMRMVVQVSIIDASTLLLHKSPDKISHLRK
jgi:hypothetical protein